MRFIQKDIQDIIKDLALKHNLPVKSVTDIVESQFDFVTTEIKKGIIGDESTFSSILLKYLGTFAFSKTKHESIGKLMNKKNEEYTGELQPEE